MKKLNDFITQELLVDLEQAQGQIKEKMMTKHEEYVEVILSIVGKSGVKNKLENKIREMMKGKMNLPSKTGISASNDFDRDDSSKKEDSDDYIDSERQ